MKCRRFRCPACGWFGRKARRRARDAEDALHIAWAHSLVAPRPTTIRVPGVRMTLHTHDPSTSACGSGCREYPEEDMIIQTSHTPVSDYARWDERIRADMAESVAEAIEADRIRAEEITAALALAPDCDRCPDWVAAHPVGTCWHARMEAFDARQWPSQRRAEERAAEIAEVVGPLSYEEQSEMIGDPIADVIRRETE